MAGYLDAVATASPFANSVMSGVAGEESLMGGEGGWSP